MENLIVAGIIAVLLVFGILSAVKHFKGQGGCCGGDGTVVKAEAKKLDHVIGQKTVIIDGMHCDHCKKWVEESINEIDGAAAVVDLSKKAAIVSMEKEVSDNEIKNAVIKAGYKVIEIR